MTVAEGIARGLVSDLVTSVVLLPTLYVRFQSERDQLPDTEAAFES